MQGNYAYIANNQFGSLEIVDISHVGSSPPSAVVVNDNGELFLSPLFDNLGNHIANQNIALSNNWLSNDGSDEGISISGVGNVGIGTDAPEGLLDLQNAIKFQTSGIGTTDQAHRIYFDESVNNNVYGFSMLYAGTDNPVFAGNTFGLAGNTFYILNHQNDLTGSVAMSINRASGNVGINTDLSLIHI